MNRLGALDSQTSVQIMELIKEIAKDKLVIMVTHNPELAQKYSTRIVEFKDGNLISDSNPISKTEQKQNNYKLKKTSMNFFAALHLSLSNIITKKGRTLLTAFASSIGIIGIALILSLSNGFDIQIDKFEKDTLCQMPIVISEQAMKVSEEDMNNMMGEESEDKSYPDEQIIYPETTMNDMIHTNNITKEYKEYIDNINPDWIGGISYMRATKLNVLTKINGETKLLGDSSGSVAFFPLPEQIDTTRTDTIIEDNFELIYGEMPKNKEDLLLLISTENKLDGSTFKMLGYTDEDTISFEEILGKEFKVVLNDDLYKNMGNYFVMNTNYDELYNNENCVTLKVSGIIRGKEGNKFGEYSGNGFTYKEELMTYLIEKNSNSAVVKAQQEKDYNVLTGEKFDLTSEEGMQVKEQILAYLGDDKTPALIQVYPKNFDTKSDILNYLDKYNEGKSDDDKIIYLDQAEMITQLSGGIMDAITIVLVAFSAISLVVSSIMIAIITYISVLERTKEIGILRAIGARKKDITRVFNAETFIIGLFSGLIGIGIASALLIPTNAVLKNLTDLDNVAQMNPIHALVLIIISVVLILIGGFIPAKIAAKKDPVNALRTE